MYELTSRERISRMFEHKEADRIPIWDDPWLGTVARWHREGMPEDVYYTDYFSLDKIAYINVDNSPRYDEKVIEETGEYKIYTTSWGATLKEFRYKDSTPEFLDFKISSAEQWLESRKRMFPEKDRIPWEYLKQSYNKWEAEGFWIVAGLWFGFDVTHSWTVGTETLLIALLEEPDWCKDMFNYFLDVDLALLDMVWEAGYRFDSIKWPDDMGYKNKQFFSVEKYRELLKPVHKKAINWAHSKGIKAHLHSCGDINPFIPELIEIGLDALNPMEVKAGMNPLEIKKKYGSKLVLHGGINAVLWNDIEAIINEMEEIIPTMKESGGYIFATDHSIPNNVSLNSFRRVVDTVKRIGSYH